MNNPHITIQAPGPGEDTTFTNEIWIRYGKPSRIILSEGWIYIGESAFNGATELQTIRIPASVRFILRRAFENASELYQVEFAQGSRLFSIDNHAFAGATSLEEINIPASLHTINELAFTSTPILTEITFEPNSRISKIYRNAFEKSGLTRVVIGEYGLSSLNDYRMNISYPQLSPLHFGKNNFYGKNNVEIVPMEPQINPRLRVTRKPDGNNSSPSGGIFNFFNGLRGTKIVPGPAGGARKSITRKRGIRRKSRKASTTRRMQKRRRTMKRK